MRAVIFLFFVFLMPLVSNAQNPKAKLDASFASEDILSDSGYLAKIKFTSFYTDTVFLPDNYFVSNDISGFGQLMISCQELVDSCFQTMRIVNDPYFPIGWEPKFYKLNYLDSCFYVINIKRVVLSSLPPGFYRFKFLQSYRVSNEWMIIASEWKYVHVNDPTYFQEQKEFRRKVKNK